MEEHLLDADYADGIPQLDNTKEGLLETTDLLCKYGSAYAFAGLKTNAGKKKSIAVSKSAPRGHMAYRANDTYDINIVTNFTYLEAVIR